MKRRQDSEVGDGAPQAQMQRIQLLAQVLSDDDWRAILQALCNAAKKDNANGIKAAALLMRYTFDPKLVSPAQETPQPIQWIYVHDGAGADSNEPTAPADASGAAAGISQPRPLRGRHRGNAGR